MRKLLTDKILLIPNFNNRFTLNNGMVNDEDILETRAKVIHNNGSQRWN